MNFRNILWTYRPRRDGTCDIKIYLNHAGNKKYFSTGLKVQPQHWDDKKGMVRRSHPFAVEYNAKIRTVRIEIERHFLEGGSWTDLLQEKQEKDLIEFLESLIREGEEGLLPLTKGTLKNYRSLLTRLIQFRKQYKIAATLESLDIHFYTEFTRFLSDYGNCGLPGIDKHVKVLKRVMNIGLERGLHQNRAHQQPGFKRYRSSTSQKIFLTEEEVERLEAVDLSHRSPLAKELDRWLVAYHFLLRYSDVVRISRDNLQQIDDRLFFRYRSVKTGKEAMVPIKRRALELLEKHNFDFSWSTNQQANRQVKMAIAAAGINEMIEQDGALAPKSSLVTMHTARRSAATNLYLSGDFSLKTIADLGGWEGIKTLQVYLRCSNLDSAKLAANSSYFD